MNKSAYLFPVILVIVSLILIPIGIWVVLTAPYEFVMNLGLIKDPTVVSTGYICISIGAISFISGLFVANKIK